MSTRHGGHWNVGRTVHVLHLVHPNKDGADPEERRTIEGGEMLRLERPLITQGEKEVAGGF